MRENKTTKLISWVLWKPLQFSALFVALAIACSTILFGTNIHALQIATPIITVILGILLLVRMLPNTTYINRRSFILTTNTIWIISTLAIAIIAPIIAKYNAPDTPIATNWFLPTLELIAMVMLGVYALGLTIVAIYLTYRRLRTLKVPFWKIILGYPVGVSALTTMAYILDTNDKNSPCIESNSKTLNKLTDWTMARPRNAIILYTFVFLATSMFTSGFIALLLNLTAILIMALTVVNVGQKNFIKDMGGKYATVCVIMNLVVIIATSLLFTLVPAITDPVTININDTVPAVEQNM